MRAAAFAALLDGGGFFMTVIFYGNIITQAKGAASFAPQHSLCIRALIDELGGHFGEAFRAFLLAEGTCFFLVNGRAIMSTGGLDTRLSPGDRVEILPFIEAG